MQWHYLYSVLNDYVRALKMLDKNIHSWILAAVVITLTALLVTEAFFVHKDTKNRGKDV